MKTVFQAQSYVQGLPLQKKKNFKDVFPSMDENGALNSYLLTSNNNNSNNNNDHNNSHKCKKIEDIVTLETPGSSHFDFETSFLGEASAIGHSGRWYLSVQRGETFIFSVWISPAVDLLEGMLLLDPETRLTAKQGLSHPFLAEYHDPECEPDSDPYDDSFESLELAIGEWKSKYSCVAQAGGDW